VGSVACPRFQAFCQQFFKGNFVSQHQFMRTKLSLVVAAVFAASVAPAAMADNNSTQVQQMQQEIQSLEQRLEALQTQTQQTQAKVDQTTAKVDQTQVKADQTQVKVDQLSGLVPIGDKNGKTNVHSVQFGGVNVTLGGFAAEENVYRTSSLQSDVNSPFSKIAFAPVNGVAAPTNSYYNNSEFRMSERQSRFDLLAQGDVDPNTVLSAYYEFDFLGAASTANSNESNSFTPRTRHVYGTVDWLNTGWHLLAGQTWSLATMNSQGITPRNEVTPLTIDAQYVPGFVWARQSQIRVTKDWDKKYWAAISLENAQNPGVGEQLGAIGGGLLNSNGSNATNYSVNKYPDVIAKFAAETGLGHYEIFGMERNFQSTVGNTATGAQQNTWGGSVGAGMIIPVMPKQLDINLSGLYGNGVGRYGTTGLADAALDNNGNLQLLTGYSVLGAAIWHADPKLDIYLDIGEDVAEGSTYTNGATTIGYGNGVTTVTGFNGAAGGVGAGQLNKVAQVTLGMWWSAYKGSYGAAKLGLQYSHTNLTDFQLASNGPTPTTSDNMVFTSLRYYPF
jgi:hypothetical protein